MMHARDAPCACSQAIKGLTRAQSAARSVGILEGVRLMHVAHTPAGGFSGGMKRRLSCAVALVGDPKFVLLDEPTAGMDPASRRTAWAVMAAGKVGRAVVLTTHFLDEADALGDRVAILHKGRLQCVGTTAELKETHGTSYHLTISRAADGASSGEMLALAKQSVPEAEIEAESPDEVALTLPQRSVGQFSALFTDLDKDVLTPLPLPKPASQGSFQGQADPDAR